MLKHILSFALITITINLFSQEISDMKWGADFNIHVTLSNDSTSILDVKALYHVNDDEGTNNGVTYYPVTLDPTFIENLKNRELKSFEESKTNNNNVAINKTLWSALNPQLGGGYIHFINCLIYSFEAGNLSITAPLMTRPVSDWKPSPMTDTYKRTKKWKYYVPDNQKIAIKEYKKQEKENNLGDIMLLPTRFINIFNSTNDKMYLELTQNHENNKIAIIDMMRLLIGSKYLAKEQIDYIQNAVVKSVMHYNVNHLPSVIIFDNYNAAVAMTLDKDGYNIEKVVFNNENQLSQQEIDDRLKKMEAVISGINETNRLVFEKNLKNYYTE